MLDRMSSRRTIDPLFTLQIPLSSTTVSSSLISSASSSSSGNNNNTNTTTTTAVTSVSSVCFLPTSKEQLSNYSEIDDSIRSSRSGNDEPSSSNSSDDDDDWSDDSTSGNSSSSDEDDDDDNEELHFRCTNMILQEGGNKRSRRAYQDMYDASTSASLNRQYLASCHTNGKSYIWDLGRRRIVSEFPDGTSSQRDGSAGLVIRRIGDGTTSCKTKKILYQTRDRLGTVSIHDMERIMSSSYSSSSNNVKPTTRPPISCCPIVTQYHTKSLTFCSSSPCYGNTNLLVLPNENSTYFTVRDIRVSPTSKPVIEKSSSSCGSNNKGNENNKVDHGMVCSLSMSEVGGGMWSSTSTSTLSSSHPIVACGMESGTMFFHDLRQTSTPLSLCNNNVAAKKQQQRKQQNEELLHVEDYQMKVSSSCSYKLGTDPILCLDMVPSSSSSKVSNNPSGPTSVITIAGMAGDLDELMQLSESERGTIAVLKTSTTIPNITTKLQSRLHTCNIFDGESNSSSKEQALTTSVRQVDLLQAQQQSPPPRGKPGVSICRFRTSNNDGGRVFSIGGWDRRLRIFDRQKVIRLQQNQQQRQRTKKNNNDTTANNDNSSPLLAILKSHTESITTTDWSPTNNNTNKKNKSNNLIATGSSDGRICIWNCSF